QRGNARGGCGTNTASCILQCVAGDRSGRIAGRPDRVRWHRRTPSGPADGWRRSPHRVACIGALRCGISHRVRFDRADRACTRRSAGGGGDRDAWRAVLLMAARQAKLTRCVFVLLLLCGVNLLGSPEPPRAPQRSAPLPTVAPLPAVATRVVSLVPNVTEMLFAVGAGPQVVGVSSYDDFPPETKALP